MVLFCTGKTKGLRRMIVAYLKLWAIRLLAYDFKVEYVRKYDFLFDRYINFSIIRQYSLMTMTHNLH